MTIEVRMHATRMPVAHIDLPGAPCVSDYVFYRGQYFVVREVLWVAGQNAYVASLPVLFVENAAATANFP